MTITSAAAQSKASPGYVIKNPNKVITDFTVTNEAKAAKALNIESKEQIIDLKQFLKGYDMTRISTDERKIVGRKLFENDLITEEAFSVFLYGSMAFDKNGRQTDTHVKFNAIALFDERLEDHKGFLESYSDQAKREKGFLPWKEGMTIANQAINALAYFIKSSRYDLSIDEKA